MGTRASSREGGEYEEDGAKRKPEEASEAESFGAAKGCQKRTRKARTRSAKAQVAMANKAVHARVMSEHAIKGECILQVQMHGRLERPSLLLSWVAGLVETNMRSMYEKGWGWDGDAKLDELASVKARYIIASLLPSSGTTSSSAVSGARPSEETQEHDSSVPLVQLGATPPAISETGLASRAASVDASDICESAEKGACAASEAGRQPQNWATLLGRSRSGCSAPGQIPVGFVHYRFCTDGGRAVLYVYEIQVSPHSQGMGIGKVLLSASESIAKEAGMQRVMLTVFSHNPQAQRFYLQNGYSVDGACPSLQDPQCCFRVFGKDVPT